MGVVCTAEKDLPWGKQKKEFVSIFKIGKRFHVSYDIVPLTFFVHPIFVYGDYDGEARKFFCALPKRNWTDYFSNKIVVREDRGDAKSEGDESDKEEIED